MNCGLWWSRWYRSGATRIHVVEVATERSTTSVCGNRVRVANRDSMEGARRDRLVQRQYGARLVRTLDNCWSLRTALACASGPIRRTQERLDWSFVSVDGCMTKAPLGRGENRTPIPPTGANAEPRSVQPPTRPGSRSPSSWQAPTAMITSCSMKLSPMQSGRVPHTVLVSMACAWTRDTTIPSLSIWQISTVMSCTCAAAGRTSRNYPTAGNLVDWLSSAFTAGCTAPVDFSYAGKRRPPTSSPSFISPARSSASTLTHQPDRLGCQPE